MSLRDLKRNLESVYYRPLLRVEEKTDADGFVTGEKIRVFGDVEEIRMNVSPPKSALNQRGYSTEAFGIDIDYDRTLVNFGKCPIEETSMIWIGFYRGIKAYSQTKTYKVGEYVSKDGAIYECNTSIPNPEAFDPSHWEECKPNFIVRRVSKDARHGGGNTIAIKEVPLNVD